MPGLFVLAYFVSEALVSVQEVASRLPDLPTVKAWSQALAVLDAILTPEPPIRCFSYSALPEDEPVAAWRDGCGDEYTITFTPHGAFARGSCHESPLRDERYAPSRPWPGLLEGVPETLRDIAQRVTFDESFGANATVTMWRLAGDTVWSYGRVDYPADLAAGWRDVQSADLFDHLDGRPEVYATAIEDTEGVVLNLDAVAHVFAHRPLTEDVVAALIRSERSRIWRST